MGRVTQAREGDLREREGMFSFSQNLHHLARPYLSIPCLGGPGPGTPLSTPTLPLSSPLRGFKVLTEAGPRGKGYSPKAWASVPQPSVNPATGPRPAQTWDLQPGSGWLIDRPALHRPSALTPSPGQARPRQEVGRSGRTPRP